MPRRMIESDIWFNEKVGNLPLPGRLLFIGVFSNADDDGRLIASPKYLKAQIFPYDEDITTQQVSEWRDQCVKANLFFVYNSNGREVLQIPGWAEHQSIRADRYKPSKLPPPNDNHPPTLRQPSDNQVTTKRQPLADADKVSIDKNSINIIKGDIKIKSPPQGEDTKKVFEQLDKLRGYRPIGVGKRKGEAASIIRMLKAGYKPEQIIEAWQKLKQDKFWQDKELFMMSVESQIGALTRSGTHKGNTKGNSRALPSRDSYEDPETFRQRTYGK